MEVKQWDYAEYPEFRYDGADGIIETTDDEVAVCYTKDVVYATVDGYDLHLQIMTPYSRNQPVGSRTYPCMLYVQGSAWMKQDCYAGVPLVSKYAQRGYVVGIIEYRHSGIAPFPACIVDARNAVRFMKKNAETFHIDPEKIVLAGSSSGGHTAVYAGMWQDDEEDTNLYPGISAKVKAILDYYGSVSVMAPDSNPTTVNHCLPDSPEGMEMGHVNLLENPDLQRKLSVECNVTEGMDLPPILIFHGTKDRIVNPSGSVVLYEKLKECGYDVKFYLVKGADHGGAEFFQDAILDLTIPFFERCMND